MGGWVGEDVATDDLDEVDHLGIDCFITVSVGIQAHEGHLASFI